MRHRIVYCFLCLVKILGRCFYTYEGQWIGKMPEDPWQDYRLVAILNHTSLFEFLFAGVVPNKFLARMARHGVVPIASKTMNRPLVGVFWRWVAGNIVSISRERDDTWKKFMEAIDDRAMVIILPEGHMKRANGLDSRGRPLVVRSGIADLIEVIGEGKMLIAYSQGLHHVQVPDRDALPKLFQSLRMRFEVLDLAEYRAECQAKRQGGSFRAAVIKDLTARRDRYCSSDTGERTELEAESVPEASSEAA